MNKSDGKVKIFKTLWGKRNDGQFYLRGAKGIPFIPKTGFDDDFFRYENQINLLTTGPAGNIHELFSSFGSTDFLMKQSIFPVVAWVENEDLIRCIGTAFAISCTGYVMTACHVLLDPKDRNYGNVIREGNTLKFMRNLNMGVLIPINPAYGMWAYRFFQFEQSWYWGEWKSSPLIHEPERFVYLTDIAICKIAEMPNGVPHQPLNLSLNRFKEGEKAYVFGYADMKNIPVEIEDGVPVLRDFEQDLYVSIGEVMTVFPENHLKKEVPTPGPCFDFRAKIPGGMSGGPILGAEGTVVRGVVSQSSLEENHSYGAILGPVMNLRLIGDVTLRSMMETGDEGIARVQGEGL